MNNRIPLRADEDVNITFVSDSVDMPDTIVVENDDYNELKNKPSIEGNTLIGDKSLEQLGITKDALDITAESLGITPETMGMGTADEYAIYSLFH